MTRTRIGTSTRAHVLSIVLLGAIVPLAIVAAWLTRGGVRSGEDLLRGQLTSSLENIASVAAARWEVRRADLLLLANNETAPRIVSGRMTPADSQFISQAAGALDRSISSFEVRDAAARIRWGSGALPRPDASNSLRAIAPSGPSFSVALPITDSNGVSIGSVVARVRLSGVLPSDSARMVVPGSALAVQDARGGVLASLAGQTSFAPAGRQQVNGSPWIVVQRKLIEPPLTIELAAPAGPYVEPFERAARIGLAALVVVTMIALVVTNFMTSRFARSLRGMVDAADAVSRGDLERRVEASGPAELNQLARTFNVMTESLRRTIAELSERRALAAVGEFAASLSHEVRNALTPVEVDLERAQERVVDDPKTHALVARALSQVSRLDSTVTGALAVARSGHVQPRDVDLRETLESAIRAATPTFQASGSVVSMSRTLEAPIHVRGDPDALRQMFLNLLLNAGQAVSPGGTASLDAKVTDASVFVYLEDNGGGIAEEHISRVTQPFFTTRANGTGLGLPIARQIAVAHGGALDVVSEVGRGTKVTVVLPAKSGDLGR